MTVARRPVPHRWRAPLAIVALAGAAVALPASAAHAAVPGQPTGVSGLAEDAKVKLTWTAPSDTGGAVIDYYQVRYSVSNDGSWTDYPHHISETVKTIGPLANGTSYVFEVRAHNQSGSTGTYSDPSAPVTPHGHIDSTSIAASKPRAIKYGGKATVTTTLTDTTTSTPISNAQVTLLRKPSNRPSYKPIPGGPLTTDGNGQARMAFAPKLNTFYRWSYAGDAGHRKATSTPTEIAVSQVVHAALTKKKVKRRKSVEVWGTIQPDGNGKTVTLQQLRSGHWRRLPVYTKARVQKLPNGKRKAGFILVFTPKKKGVDKLRVVSDATRQSDGGISKRLRLKVT
jgi:hypothetical protein